MEKNRLSSFPYLFYPVLLLLLLIAVIPPLLAPLFDSAVLVVSRWAIFFAETANLLSTLFTFVGMGAALYAAARRGFASGLAVHGIHCLLCLVLSCSYLWNLDQFYLGAIIASIAINAVLEALILSIGFFLLFFIFFKNGERPPLYPGFSSRMFSAIVIYASANLVYQLAAETISVIDAVNANVGIVYATDVLDMAVQYLLSILYVGIGALSMYLTVRFLERRAAKAK
jgi:hypothetical protein